MRNNIITIAGRDYHLTKKHGYWHYWWWQWDGKQWKRPLRSLRVRLKRDAHKELHKRLGTTGGRFRDLTQDFFIRGRCPYLAYKDKRGGLADGTVAQHRYFLTEKLWRIVGDVRPDLIDEAMVESEVWKLSLGASSIDHIVGTLRICLQELKRKGEVSSVPQFRSLTSSATRNTTGVLTRAEVAKLFPASITELGKVWQTREQTFSGDGTPKGDQFGTVYGLLFLVMLQGNLRPGEARAVHRDQIFPDHQMLLVNRLYDGQGRLRLPKQDKIRWTVLPAQTMGLLRWWMEHHSYDPIFSLYGEPIDKDQLRKRFRAGLAKAGIDPAARNLRPYSLRYTYRTLTEGWLDTTEMMGHADQGIHDWYLHITEDQLTSYQEKKETVNRLWSTA
jgi:integrase